jgi:hypothetical protein
VIALSKLYSLNDSRLAQTQVKGDLIVGKDDGLIKTRSRAKQSMSPATHNHPTTTSCPTLIVSEELAPGA